MKLLDVLSDSPDNIINTSLFKPAEKLKDINTDDFNEVIFVSIDQDGNITVNDDGEIFVRKLSNLFFPENEKNSSVITFNQKTVDILNNTLSGKTLYLEKTVKNKDSNGNEYRYFWLEKPDGEKNSEQISSSLLNAVLIGTGTAVYNDSKLNNKYEKELKVISEYAKKNKKGIFNILSEKEIAEVSKSNSDTAGY